MFLYAFHHILIIDSFSLVPLKINFKHHIQWWKETMGH